MAVLVERKNMSTSRVPPVKREVDDEMFDGAFKITSSESIPSEVTCTSGMTATDGLGGLAADSENCAKSERWTLEAWRWATLGIFFWHGVEVAGERESERRGQVQFSKGSN